MTSEESENSPPEKAQVRRALLAFSELVRRLDDEDRLLEATPLLLQKLGDLRRILFDHEVRGTERLLPVEDPTERESRRVVRDAIERYEAMIEEWDDGWEPPEGDGDEEEDDD